MDETLRDVLGTMFFTAVLSEGGSDECEAAEHVAMCVHFCGDEPGEASLIGEFRLRIGYPAATVLASNFLGKELEEGVSGDERNAVVGELSNILCGSFLSKYEADTLFRLGSPEPIADHPFEGGPSVFRQHYLIDSGCLELALALRPDQ